MQLYVGHLFLLQFLYGDLKNWPHKANFVYLDQDYYGPAITTSYEQDGVIYVTNGEYLTQVNYCPFTGKKGAVTPEYNREDTFYKQQNFWEWG